MKSCNNNKNKATTNGKATYRHLNQAFSLNGGQSGALEWLIDNKIHVTIHLTTGIRLDCIISAFDIFTLHVIDSKGKETLLYKDYISTITVKR